KNIMTKNYTDVVRFAKLLVARDANDIGALGALLQAHILLQTEPEGIAYLNELVSQSANAWGPDYVMAAHSLRSRDFAGARQHINKAVSKSAYAPATTALYAQVYQAAAAFEAQSGDLGKAREIILEAMQNNEVTPQLLHLLIKVELADNNATEAEKLLAELTQTAPGSALLYHAQGDIAANKQDSQAAI